MTALTIQKNSGSLAALPVTLGRYRHRDLGIERAPIGSFLTIFGDLQSRFNYATGTAGAASLVNTPRFFGTHISGFDAGDSANDAAIDTGLTLTPNLTWIVLTQSLDTGADVNTRPQPIGNRRSGESDTAWLAEVDNSGRAYQFTAQFSGATETVALTTATTVTGWQCIVCRLSDTEQEIMALALDGSDAVIEEAATPNTALSGNFDSPNQSYNIHLLNNANDTPNAGACAMAEVALFNAAITDAEVLAVGGAMMRLAQANGLTMPAAS